MKAHLRFDRSTSRSTARIGLQLVKGVLDDHLEFFYGNSRGISVWLLLLNEKHTRQIRIAIY